MRVVQPPPGPMPTFTAFTPRSARKLHALRGGDVAGHELEVAEPRAERFDGARHDHRMAVRDVDDDDVDARAHQLRGALEVVALGADRRADEQPAVRVARRKRQPLLADDVLGRDQADERAVAVDERQLLDLSLDHQPLGRLERELALADDEPIDRRHARVDRARIGAGTKRTSRSVSRPFSRLRSSTTTSVPDAPLPHQRDRLRPSGVRRRDRVRIANDRRAACA